MDNIFSNIPNLVADELFKTLHESKNLKIERVVSDGHASPSGFWYDQDQNEFVIVLEGKATIEYKDGPAFEMSKGDYIIIHAHQLHRVVSTSQERKTIWLTVTYN